MDSINGRGNLGSGYGAVSGAGRPRKNLLIHIKIIIIQVPTAIKIIILHTVVAVI